MKFRKKPVEIEAIQFINTEDNIKEVSDFLKTGSRDFEYKDNQFLIKTLEGIMAADINDWIIKGVKGEFYPCKPDVFEATYDRVSELRTFEIIHDVDYVDGRVKSGCLARKITAKNLEEAKRIADEDVKNNNYDDYSIEVGYYTIEDWGDVYPSYNICEI